METTLIAIGTLAPLLLILVVVHEMGHFFTARALGVKVLEFGVGFPPKLFGIYTGKTGIRIDAETRFVNVPDASGLRPGQIVTVGSTEDPHGNLLAKIIEAPPTRTTMNRFSRKDQAEAASIPEELLRHQGKVKAVEQDALVVADMLYSVNVMPLGGFVRLAGESNPAVPRSLAGKGVGTRIIVLVAGPLMNAVLPIAIFTILFMVPQDVTIGNLVVNQVSPGSPAAQAGLQPGDTILRTDGNEIENLGDLTRAINLNGGSQMEWLVLRGNHEDFIPVQPMFDSDSGRWLVGILPTLENRRVVSRSQPLWEAVPESFVSTWELLVLVKQAIFGSISTGSAPEFSGPIGIAQLTGEVTREAGLAGWLALGILISVNLAILNILPIPMLDGGRLFFVILEWLRRGKRVPPEKEGMVHLIGFAMLIAVILIVSANDINRLIQGKNFLG
jgi:regulator of sigma E protease